MAHSLCSYACASRTRPATVTDRETHAIVQMLFAVACVQWADRIMQFDNVVLSYACGEPAHHICETTLSTDGRLIR